MLRIGRMAGSISRPTPGRPGSASGRPWALPIRSRLISPMRLSSALLYHAAARSRAGSLSLRLGLVSGPPRGPALALAPLQAPLLTASALKHITLRIGHAAGSTTPPTPGRPGPAYSGPWALPIRSGVCLPCVPILRASLCLDEVWRLVRRYPITEGAICPENFQSSALCSPQIRSKARRGLPSSV